MADTLELAISFMTIAVDHINEAVISRAMTSMFEVAPESWTVGRLMAAFTNQCDNDLDWVRRFSLESDEWWDRSCLQ
jgi:hypothetical protein